MQNRPQPPCERSMASCTPDQSGQCPPATGGDVPPFDFGVRLGLVFVVEAASLSAIAVLALLGYIGVGVPPLNC